MVQWLCCDLVIIWNLKYVIARVLGALTKVVWIILLQPGVLWHKVKVRHIRHFVVYAGVALQRQVLRSIVFQNQRTCNCSTPNTKIDLGVQKGPP